MRLKRPQYLYLEKGTYDCNLLQRTAPHILSCIEALSVESFADNCNTLQQITAHCIALQRTATCCNMHPRT